MKLNEEKCIRLDFIIYYINKNPDEEHIDITVIDLKLSNYANYFLIIHTCIKYNRTKVLNWLNFKKNLLGKQNHVKKLSEHCLINCRHCSFMIIRLLFFQGWRNS